MGMHEMLTAKWICSKLRIGSSRFGRSPGSVSLPTQQPQAVAKSFRTFSRERATLSSGVPTRELLSHAAQVEPKGGLI